MTSVLSSVVHRDLNNNNYNNNVNGVCLCAYNIIRRCTQATMPVQIMAKMCKFPDKDKPNVVLVFCYGNTVESHYDGHLWDWPTVTFNREVTILSGLSYSFSLWEIIWS